MRDNKQIVIVKNVHIDKKVYLYRNKLLFLCVYTSLNTKQYEMLY